MTTTRRQQLDRILRNLRRSDSPLWGNQGQEKEDQAERVIFKIRARLRPIEKAEHRERMNKIFEQRYNADTAINYA
jgi:hypothetical protein